MSVIAYDQYGGGFQIEDRVVSSFCLLPLPLSMLPGVRCDATPLHSIKQHLFHRILKEMRI